MKYHIELKHRTKLTATSLVIADNKTQAKKIMQDRLKNAKQNLQGYEIISITEFAY